MKNELCDSLPEPASLDELATKKKKTTKKKHVHTTTVPYCPVIRHVGLELKKMSQLINIKKKKKKSRAVL